MTVYTPLEVAVAGVLQVTPDQLPAAVRGVVAHAGSTRKAAVQIDQTAREQGRTRGDMQFVSHDWVARRARQKK